MTHLQEADLRRVRTDGEFTLRYDPMDRLISVDGVSGGEFNPFELRFPIRVVTEINSMCNMHCTYCSQHENERGPKLRTEDVLGIIEQANAGKAFELALRGGEATLHPDFNEIWKHATSQDHVSANLITNGLILNEQMVLGLLDNVRSKLIISLDGPDEINSRFRDPRQYKRVMKWIIPVLKERGDQITILTTIYKDNLPSLPDFCKYLSDLGLRHHHFTLMKKIGSAPIEKLGFSSEEEIRQFEQILNQIVAINPNYLPSINSPMVRGPQNPKNMLTNVPIPNFTEYYPGTGIKIMADGRIGISQMIFFGNTVMGNVGSPDSRLGTVGESLQNVWNRSLEIRRAQVQASTDNYRLILGLTSQ